MRNFFIFSFHKNCVPPKRRKPKNHTAPRPPPTDTHRDTYIPSPFEVGPPSCGGYLYRSLFVRLLGRLLARSLPCFSRSFLYMLSFSRYLLAWPTGKIRLSIAMESMNIRFFPPCLGVVLGALLDDSECGGNECGLVRSDGRIAESASQLRRDSWEWAFVETGRAVMSWLKRGADSMRLVDSNGGGVSCEWHLVGSRSGRRASPERAET